ncbi:MAG: hypothetical protein AAF633_16370 [Chloroflexota bacterium]
MTTALQSSPFWTLKIHGMVMQTGITAERSNEEMLVSNALTPHLAASEMLLAFTAGRIDPEPDAMQELGHHLYLGLTSHRFLLYFPQVGEVLPIWRATVTDLEWESGIRTLRMHFKTESLNIVCRGSRWADRASLFVEIDQTVPIRPELAQFEDNLVQRRLMEVAGLKQLGFEATAQRLLNEARPAQPWDPSTGQFEASLRDQQFALRSTSLFLLAQGTAELILGSQLQIPLFGIILAVVDFIIAAQLWRGKPLLWGKVGGKVAQLRAVLVGGLVGLILFSAGDLGGIWPHLLLALIVPLALGGSRRRGKTWMAIGIFLIGWALILGFLFLL